MNAGYRTQKLRPCIVYTSQSSTKRSSREPIVRIAWSAELCSSAVQRNLPMIELPIPGILTEIAKGLTSFRFGIDFGELDHLSRADHLSAPILLFHGDTDKTVPITTSSALANARPDIVEYVRNANVGHVHSWNSDGAAYEETVTDFLRGLTE